MIPLHGWSSDCGERAFVLPPSVDRWRKGAVALRCNRNLFQRPASRGAAASWLLSSKAVMPYTAVHGEFRFWSLSCLTWSCLVCLGCAIGQILKSISCFIVYQQLRVRTLGLQCTVPSTPPVPFAPLLPSSMSLGGVVPREPCREHAAGRSGLHE